MYKENELPIKNTAIRRVKILVQMQIGNKLRALKEGDKKQLAFKLLLGVLLIIAITFGLNFLLGYLKNTFLFKVNVNMLTSILFITQIISILSCLGNTISVLYTSKENTILLAFPCKYNEIFISKIIVFYLEELKKSCFFILPFLLAFGLNSAGGFTYWLLLPLAFILLSLFPVLICSSLSIVIIYLKKCIKMVVF